MNYILIIIIYSIILLVILANKINSKFCVNCKFFRKDFFDSNEFGKCILFLDNYENNNNYNKFLVTGVLNNDDIKPYNYCKIARKYEDMCGKDGKLHEKK